MEGSTVVKSCQTVTSIWRRYGETRKTKKQPNGHSCIKHTQGRTTIHIEWTDRLTDTSAHDRTNRQMMRHIRNYSTNLALWDKLVVTTI